MKGPLRGRVLEIELLIVWLIASIFIFVGEGLRAGCAFAEDQTSAVPASAQLQDAEGPSEDPPAPGSPVKLIFIHHSTGENWLADYNGKLASALRNNNYFVSDTNYGWGPDDLDVGEGTIGDHTDIGHWYNWFLGPNRGAYLGRLYRESGKHSDYTRLKRNPGGANKIILFKSCFPNSNLSGNPDDPPTRGSNPLRGQSSGSEHMTVGNAKGIYKNLLKYFENKQDTLFVLITSPPLASPETTRKQAANARGLNNWLVSTWLKHYPYKNVAVFDYYNVLTSNGGNSDMNDLGSATGNHHRWRKGAVQHIQTVPENTSAYPTGDSHPSQAGNLKAKAELLPLLNHYYNTWQANLPTSAPDSSTQ